MLQHVRDVWLINVMMFAEKSTGCSIILARSALITYMDKSYASSSIICLGKINVWAKVSGINALYLGKNVWTDKWD